MRPEANRDASSLTGFTAYLKLAVVESPATGRASGPLWNHAEAFVLAGLVIGTIAPERAPATSQVKGCRLKSGGWVVEKRR
jgi:hypothetical protein